MSTTDQPSTSGLNCRRTQRYKRGGHQPQLGSQARFNISQILHRKGQTHAPPDTDDRSLAIGGFHDAPLQARMLSPQVYPAVGQRGEIDNDCLYIHHPSRRLDLQSPLALRPISPAHDGLGDNKRLRDASLHPRPNPGHHQQHYRRPAWSNANTRDTYLTGPSREPDDDRPHSRSPRHHLDRRRTYRVWYVPDPQTSRGLSTCTRAHPPNLYTGNIRSHASS